MKITVLGCGNAFSKKSYNQSFLVEEDGRTMLIDCGNQTPNALENAGIPIKDIDDIYISHLHADHIGGLEEVAFTRYDWMNTPRKATAGFPTLIGNVKLLEDLWDKSLRGGLESMEGFVSNINTFFHTQPIEPNESFAWQGWTVSLVQQVHIMSGSVIMPSFGIMFEKAGHKSAYFVTDSQHCSPRQVENFYNKADLIFQDCECIGVDLSHEEGELVDDIPHKRFKFGSGVHANYGQLAGYDSANSVKLSDEIKSKMWLSHYQDFVLENKDFFGNRVDWQDVIDNDGFAGIVIVGQNFDI